MDTGEIKKYIGNWYQIAGTRHATLSEGSAKGTRIIDVRTGGGLEYTIVCDRGLDISLASYNGVNFTYLSANGEVHPAYYNCIGSEWLRVFFAGLLTTCGPVNIGPACIDQGEHLGLHGRFNVTPAVKVCDLTDYDAENPGIKITGEILNDTLFSEKIKFRREIFSPFGKNLIQITDKAMNYAAKAVPFAILYHINFGYPFLDENTLIHVNGSGVEPMDENANSFKSEINSFKKPVADVQEKNYLYSFKGIKTGTAYIINKISKLVINIRFDTQTLKFLNLWKMGGVNEYVLALEPCNVPCKSRKELRNEGQLEWLQPGETKVIKFEIEVSREE